MKFNVEVIRTDQFEIDIDPEYWTPERLAEWSNVFSKVESPQELAELLGQRLTSTNHHDFHEGFGYLKIIRSNGNQVRHWDDGKALTDDDRCQGIVVHLIDFDEDYSTTSYEKENTDD